MKNNLLTVAIAAALGLTSMVPLANARAGESTTFTMVKSAGAVSCLKATARGRVTISAEHAR
jgi:hypothetical protein